MHAWEKGREAPNSEPRVHSCSPVSFEDSTTETLEDLTPSAQVMALSLSFFLHIKERNPD